MAKTRRVRARVEGTVQGVGFRPYVFRLAGELGLAGWVLNDSRGVLLEVEGAPEAVDGFLARLPAEAPPLAAIEGVAHGELEPTGEPGFAIVASPQAGEPLALVSPDIATCEDCLAELRDPADRRHRYPFVNCTNCGPRFSIVAGVPYDRPLTTMAGFAMCPACRAEYDDPTDRRHGYPFVNCTNCGPRFTIVISTPYDRPRTTMAGFALCPACAGEYADPADRRFHAQPVCCPACGPHLALLDGSGRPLAGDPLAAAAGRLKQGGIVAIKGLGGYHLAVDAGSDDAVSR
ncbi:MAG: acylphosphatase, partial [Solirubrobacteraceae bacterium]